MRRCPKITFTAEAREAASTNLLILKEGKEKISWLRSFKCDL